ncbi:MAG: STAS domain-containing protein [Candidatus Zixiibacteriota bacterium]
MMSECSFKKTKISDKTAIIETGKVLDNNNAHNMVQCITELNQDHIQFIILDMIDLEFLSSAGVGSIIGTVELFREMGGDIILCQVSDQIRHILRILDLEEFLTIKENIEEAKIAHCV